MASSDKPSSKETWSSGPGLDPDIVFPECRSLTTKLPDIKTTLGLIKFHVRVGTGKIRNVGEVLREVSKLVYSKWWHDTVYCITLDAVVKKLTKLWGEYKDGVKRKREGRLTSTAVLRYIEIVQTKNQLFDIFPKDKKRMDVCELEWGVKMSPAELEYYEDQKDGRKQYCNRAVDPVWYTAMMRKQRLKERSAKAKEEMQKMMQYKSLTDIEESLLEDGEMLEESPKKVDDDEDEDFDDIVPASKRKLLDDDKDSLPLEYRHVRDSERKVKEEIYRALADMMGKGLSVHEAVHATIIVANKLFGRQWREQEKEEKDSDLSDMMPSERSIHQAMALIETEALAQTVDRMEEGKAEGRMLTHSIDSTTKQRIGQFATQGIHIGRDSALPLPLINICGETTEDIALQVIHYFLLDFI